MRNITIVLSSSLQESRTRVPPKAAAAKKAGKAMPPTRPTQPVCDAWMGGGLIEGQARHPQEHYGLRITEEYLKKDRI